jgi:hypothetical protein
LGVSGVPLVRGKVIFNIIVGEENFMDLELNLERSTEDTKVVFNF